MPKAAGAFCRQPLPTKAC